ncbi:MAG: hypothetical protein OQJ81_04500 [Melioribacteraceae bacterium]|nr:hypothetical protein [Melioribacteraceae bacterium]
MNLKKHYDDLYGACIAKVKSDNFLADNQIDSASDDRYGITLLIRPPENIKNHIQIFLDELKQLEPKQYYYPNSDIHITVMSIISCYSGFKLTQVNVDKYSQLIAKSLEEIKSFRIDFRGITATESSVMIQGFFSDPALNEIRDNLRLNFRDSDLDQSIDKRYSIQTAHSTVVRFRNEVKKKHEFLDILEKYRHYDFGQFDVKALELVANDWYQRVEKVKILSEFNLK